MNIVQNRKIYYCISLTLIVIGVIFMIINASRGAGAFNLDVEFSGGTSMEVDIGRDFDNTEISGLIAEVTGQSNPQVQRIIGTNSVSIKLLSLDQETRVKLIDAFSERFAITDENFSKISDVSPSISSDMQSAAILAILVACVAMLVYVSLRFRDVKKGSSAIIALLHDAVIVVCAYAVLRIPLNYAFIAAVLTILGYSVNATIIIFDRVRENRRLDSKIEDEELINKSVTQTLRRTVYTTLTTLLTLFSLYIFGVTSIRDFTLPIIIGIVCGTYSSIFLSGSIWYSLSHRNR